MRDYGQFCPVALGSEVLADRWTPLILREMVLGSTRFNDIERGLPGISRSLLAQRLKHLERKEVLERRPAASGRGSEYHLT
jgi:DNA-binding HxlR family transcriptional regulator